MIQFPYSLDQQNPICPRAHTDISRFSSVSKSVLAARKKTYWKHITVAMRIHWFRSAPEDNRISTLKDQRYSNSLKCVSMQKNKLFMWYLCKFKTTCPVQPNIFYSHLQKVQRKSAYAICTFNVGKTVKCILHILNASTSFSKSKLVNKPSCYIKAN